MKRILIVDDNELIRYSFIKTITHYPAEISVVSNGTNAMVEISAKHYYVCFMELQLPDVSGLEVMKRIREVSPMTKLAVMTAPPMNDTLRGFVEKEATHMITKPFDLAEIKMPLTELL
jgi:DNA-binding NtrC family response regulator